MPKEPDGAKATHMVVSGTMAAYQLPRPPPPLPCSRWGTEEREGIWGIGDGERRLEEEEIGLKCGAFVGSTRHISQTRALYCSGPRYIGFAC